MFLRTCPTAAPANRTRSKVLYLPGLCPCGRDVKHLHLAADAISALDRKSCPTAARKQRTLTSKHCARTRTRVRSTAAAASHTSKMHTLLGLPLAKTSHSPVEGPHTSSCMWRTSCRGTPGAAQHISSEPHAIIQRLFARLWAREWRVRSPREMARQWRRGHIAATTAPASQGPCVVPVSPPGT